MTTALLVIGVPHVLCSGHEAAFDVGRVIPRVNALAARASTAGAPVIVIRHERDSGPLQLAADGWQLTDGLATLPRATRSGSSRT